MLDRHSLTRRYHYRYIGGGSGGSEDGLPVATRAGGAPPPAQVQQHVTYYRHVLMLDRLAGRCAAITAAANPPHQASDSRNWQVLCSGSWSSFIPIQCEHNVRTIEPKRLRLQSPNLPAHICLVSIFTYPFLIAVSVLHSKIPLLLVKIPQPP